MNNREFGNAGEDLACKYLEEKGYEILERNKHFGRDCEIDIVAKIKDTIVFVEVKTRRTTAYGTPFESITRAKYFNLVRGVRLYAVENKIKDFRIDGIGIILKPEFKIEHLENIYL